MSSTVWIETTNFSQRVHLPISYSSPAAAGAASAALPGSVRNCEAAAYYGSAMLGLGVLWFLGIFAYQSGDEKTGIAVLTLASGATAIPCALLTRKCFRCWREVFCSSSESRPLADSRV